MMLIKNAKIKSTKLWREDHGIPTCTLQLNYGGSEQSFGSYDLRCPEYGIDYILSVIDVVGVECWEDLPGKLVRVKTDKGLAIAIGHIIEDRWYCPRDE